MDNVNGLLGIRRMDKVLNAWFGHVMRMENDRIAKRVYVGECAGSRSVGRS